MSRIHRAKCSRSETTNVLHCSDVVDIRSTKGSCRSVREAKSDLDDCHFGVVRIRCHGSRATGPLSGGSDTRKKVSSGFLETVEGRMRCSWAKGEEGPGARGPRVGVMDLFEDSSIPRRCGTIYASKNGVEVHWRKRHFCRALRNLHGSGDRSVGHTIYIRYI